MFVFCAKNREKAKITEYIETSKIVVLSEKKELGEDLHEKFCITSLLKSYTKNSFLYHGLPTMGILHTEFDSIRVTL